jgi:hypothetical protein
MTGTAFSKQPELCTSFVNCDGNQNLTLGIKSLIPLPSSRNPFYNGTWMNTPFTKPNIFVVIEFSHYPLVVKLLMTGFFSSWNYNLPDCTQTHISTISWDQSSELLELPTYITRKISTWRLIICNLNYVSLLNSLSANFWFYFFSFLSVQIRSKLHI